MKRDEGCGLKSAIDCSSPRRPPSSYVSPGGELHLSNLGQLALLRGMAERGVTLRTTVRGFSMFPFIRDQDVLTIAPLNGRIPAVGQVVAFIRPNTGRLAIHRVIARRGAAWFIRGDNSPEPDGIVSREGLLGVVTRVERKGRNVHAGLGAERAIIALLQRANALTRLAYIASWIWRIPMSVRITLARRLT
jgi:hypothetical protein